MDSRRSLLAGEMTPPNPEGALAVESVDAGRQGFAMLKWRFGARKRRPGVRGYGW